MALRQYQVCVDVPKRELGVAPDPETVALYESLRQVRVLPIGSRIDAACSVETENAADAERVTPVLKGVAPTPQSAPLTIVSPAERRHLTIVFIGLAGSMELSTRLDPEQLQALLADYQKVVTKEATRFQRHVANIMGDGMLVSFGWPNAHEDDAERAVRAALAMRESVCVLGGPDGNSL